MSLISESAVCDRGDGGAGLRRDECAAFLDALLNAFPDARLSEARAAIVGEKAILEWTFEGTHLGAWSLADQTLPSGGRSVRSVGALLIGFDEEGLIDRIDPRVDTATLLARVASSAPPVDVGDVREFATRYTDAWCGQVPARVADIFHAERGSLSVNGAAPAVGHDAIAAVADGFMTAFPDMVLEMDDLHVIGDRAVYCWTVKGTHGGPGGSGNRVQFSGYEVWQFGPDGLIAQWRGYFDSDAYNRQLLPSR